MDVLAWSALVNRLYYGESFAAAKAFILANYVTPDTAAQTLAAGEIDANESSGADLTSVGAIAPAERTLADAPWYTLQSAYVTGLDNPAVGDIGDVYTIGQSGVPEWDTPAGSELPDQTGHSGEYLTTDGSDASWGAVEALPDQATHAGEYLTTDGSDASWGASPGGVTTLAAVGSSPSANGASISGATLTLQPADLTHPGVVTIAAQTLNGLKTFDDGIQTTDTTPTSFLGVAAGETQGALWLGPTACGTKTDNNFAVQVYNSQMYLNSPSSPLHLTVNGADAAQIDTAAATLDLTPLVGGGHGTYIKVKSPDGTVYTISVANGGTLVIA